MKFARSSRRVMKVLRGGVKGRENVARAVGDVAFASIDRAHNRKKEIEGLFSGSRESRTFVTPDRNDERVDRSTNTNRTDLPSADPRHESKSDQCEPIRSDCRNKLLVPMNIFISLHQYSEPTFLTALKSTKIERRRTRSVFDRMRHDLRFLITTFYALSIRVPVPESVEGHIRCNRDDDSLSLALLMYSL